ncbi:hypothetical protein VULLAG_LOCUS8209 [Vulpes lagopus]
MTPRVRIFKLHEERKQKILGTKYFLHVAL